MQTEASLPLAQLRLAVEAVSPRCADQARTLLRGLPQASESVEATAQIYGLFALQPYRRAAERGDTERLEGFLVGFEPGIKRAIVQGALAALAFDRRIAETELATTSS